MGIKYENTRFLFSKHSGNIKRLFFDDGNRNEKTLQAFFAQKKQIFSLERAASTKNAIVKNTHKHDRHHYMYTLYLFKGPRLNETRKKIVKNVFYSARKNVVNTYDTQREGDGHTKNTPRVFYKCTKKRKITHHFFASFFGMVNTYTTNSAYIHTLFA